MDKSEITRIVATQREYFKSGKTLDVSVRISALKALKTSIQRHEGEINKALEMDLGKGAFESYMCETGMVLSELSHMLSHIRSYAKEKTVATPLAQFHARSYKKPSPYGVTLIMSPWNYPFLLTISPLIDSIAAGNTAVVKPSAYSPYTSEVIKTILQEAFNEEYVAVVTGGRAENTSLLEEHFDYIFFTGSQAVGKEVMRKASEHLTPVTLELGGKSPCIVDKTANLRLAAKRIVFGKYLNCGQTCVAPDYIYCDASIKDKLLDELRIQIKKQFKTSPLQNPDYGKIINEKHYKRLLGLMDMEKVAIGGRSEAENLRIEPTVMENVTFEDKVMQEEIFGPILPILTYDTLDEAIAQINEMPHPLALYLFTSDKKAVKKVTSSVGYGGGCINDTIIHLATTEMGFGGFGESGMGSYHGKTGFDTFTHYKSIVDKKQWIDLPMRYQPYKKVYEKMVRMFMR
ncbi:MAG: aldehyde dehydrogenase [Oscillospiraceae bacterium]|nr:aldehyde dehydrogenase [Oscillospiraceae bacterium]